MEFVEKRLNCSDLPKDCRDAQGKYEMFLKLHARPQEASEEHISKQYFAYRILMDIPSIEAQFNSVRKQRFLMHLIWQHRLIAFNLFCEPLVGKKSGVVRSLMNVASLLNHSCTPNPYKRRLGNKHICITISSVKKGEQLFIMYIADFWENSTKKRQHFFNKAFNFTCQCSRCVPSAQRTDSVPMQSDPNYRFVKNFRNRLFDVSNEDLKYNCCKFLRKYGHFPSSIEILLVKAMFIVCLKNEYFE